ncbi:hypothetical protein LMG7974_01345 [Campylobacter majalis]|uniref:Uncharacterized protein n=1 Tax=Campylobacter majalis TaxID=2790656 RepID=A0ABM8Q8J5_9BACT|nr:nucleoid-structuring protein H-NS [Campylobacter majalis]CAD7289106.1 hypothetical protein LMG7974_01345 [Campylobacter majalis]
MKKLFVVVSILALSLFASDPITIDSLYKQQVGLRSVTNLSLLSSGNPNVYTSTPNLMINGDPVVWDDTKQLTLTQTLMYALTSKLDIITSFSGSYKRNEYIDFFTLEPKSQNKTKFDNLWIGLNYRGDKIGEIIPMLTLQTAILQNESAKREQKNFTLNHTH